MATKKQAVSDSSFITFIAGLYDVRMRLDSLKVYRGCTVENYTAQSISNRAVGSFLVTAEVKYPAIAKLVTVKLSQGWQPARSGNAGYNGESVSICKAEDMWLKYRSGQIKPENQARESTAILAYCVDNLLTGAIMSGENALKALFLQYGLETLMPETFKVTLLQDKVTQEKTIREGVRGWYDVDGFKNQVVYNLPEIQALMTACLPRVNLALSVPKESIIHTTKTSRPGTIDI